MPRKEKQYHYLFKTTNLINSKFYVGMHSTNDLEDEYLGSGKRLRYSINKYGKDNFVKEIITFFKDRNELIEAEKNLVNLELIKEELCMNLMIGGTGGSQTPEKLNKWIQAMAKGLKKKWEDETYRTWMSKLSGEHLKKYHKEGKIKYDTFKDKTHTEETKNKMSEKAKLRTGDKNSSFGTCWITKEGINKKIKKEELNTYLISNWTKGRK